MQPRLALAVSLLCAACSCPAAAAAPTSSAGGETAPEPAATDAPPDLTWLADARVVRIERAWGGLGGGRVARFELIRNGEVFVGLGSLVVVENVPAAPGQPSPGRVFHTSALETRVPAEAMQRLLAALATVTPPLPPASSVRLTVTDDYPSWIVDVETDARVARFASPATGERPAPWNVLTGDRWTPIDPAIPAAACDTLAESLGDDALVAALR